MLPKNLKYTPEHQWVKVEENYLRIGLTDYGQKKIGDIVYVDLPSAGERLVAKEIAITIESIDSVMNLITPISGEVIENNDSLGHSPEFINNDPYGKGWLVIMEPDNPKDVVELLSALDYTRLFNEKK